MQLSEDPSKQKVGYRSIIINSSAGASSEESEESEESQSSGEIGESKGNEVSIEDETSEESDDNEENGIANNNESDDRTTSDVETSLSSSSNASFISSCTSSCNSSCTSVRSSIESESLSGIGTPSDTSTSEFDELDGVGCTTSSESTGSVSSDGETNSSEMSNYSDNEIKGEMDIDIASAQEENIHKKDRSYIFTKAKANMVIDNIGSLSEGNEGIVNNRNRSLNSESECRTGPRGEISGDEIDCVRLGSTGNHVELNSVDPSEKSKRNRRRRPRFGDDDNRDENLVDQHRNNSYDKEETTKSSNCSLADNYTDIGSNDGGLKSRGDNTEHESSEESSLTGDESSSSSDTSVVSELGDDQEEYSYRYVLHLIVVYANNGVMSYTIGMRQGFS